MRVISKDEAIILWDKLNSEFKFKPGTDITGEWIIVPGNTKKYHKATPWSEKQEKIINSILKELGLEKMYALDWNHDCFEFSPMEDISMNYNYYDPDRQCQCIFQHIIQMEIIIFSLIAHGIVESSVIPGEMKL